MLARMNFPVGVRAIVQTHHEKWDGTGYPARLKGDRYLRRAIVLLLCRRPA